MKKTPHYKTRFFRTNSTDRHHWVRASWRSVAEDPCKVFTIFIKFFHCICCANNFLALMKLGTTASQSLLTLVEKSQNQTFTFKSNTVMHLSRFKQCDGQGVDNKKTLQNREQIDLNTKSIND